MNTNFLKNRPSLKARYGQNGLIQLVLSIGVAFILLHGMKVIFIISSDAPQNVFSNMIPYLAISNFDDFLERPWTILTYFWGHASFWNLLSNMLWLYCFGSIIQTLVGYKEIFPLFIIANVLSGLVYLGAGAVFPEIQHSFILNALPGIVSFAAASFFLAPQFRFYITEHLSIPLWLVLLVFTLLSLGSHLNNSAYITLIIASALIGYLYVIMLKNGFRPGEKMHRLWHKVQHGFSPDLRKTAQIKKKIDFNNQPGEYMDRLLDKINKKGIQSLTEKERKDLENASKNL